MRMDRYEEDNKFNESKQTRTNKNQELYADVYLNNVYVDINNLKDVVSNQEEEVLEDIKLVRDKKVINYSYEDKNYDIVSIIDEVIKNKKDDNVKRNLDTITHEDEITSLIESIEENIASKESNEDLLTDLLPSNDNTSIIPPLEEPILDVNNISSTVIKEEMIEDKEMLDKIYEKDLDSDDSFLENDNSNLKMIISIVVILLLAGLVIAILLYKDII